MLAYFIPLAVLSTAPLLSNGSPIFPIVNAAAVALTATATVTIFQCPSVSPSPSKFAGLPILPLGSIIPSNAANGVVSSAVGLATGLPNASGVNNVVSSVVSVATRDWPAGRRHLRLPASLRVHGVVPNPIVVPSGSLSSFVSSVISGATGSLADPISLPTGVLPSSTNAGLPSSVISSALSGATGISSDVSTVFTPLSQVYSALESVSSTMPTLLGLVNNLGATLASVTGLVTQLTTGLSNLVSQLNAAAASIQSLNSVLSGLSNTTPTSAADAAQLLSQGSAIAERVASLTTQINTVVTGCHQSPTPISLTQLRSALLTLQTHFQAMYTGLIPRCGTPSQAQVLSAAWATTSTALNTCIIQT
ncbi:hypothetical protein DFH09DRAFT_1325905 [Mycena vulgaris]|nr:hypothetical protein DFH09DRAFT_1325905 [Mycena vulgaris]